MMPFSPEQYEAAERYLHDTRGVARRASAYLPGETMNEVRTLIEHGEGPEGMCSLAWAISTTKTHVPASVIQGIRRLSAGWFDDNEFPSDLNDFALPENTHDMNQHQSFHREYDISVTDNLSAAPDYEFAGPNAGARSVFVTVAPWTESSWTATFASPDPGRRALSALLATPSPTGLCVVERGTAFLGDVRDPQRFTRLPISGPVVSKMELPSENLLLLVTPRSISGIAASGLPWKTRRIAVDQIHVNGSVSGQAHGVADPGDDGSCDFEIDLTNGQVVGGAQF